MRTNTIAKTLAFSETKTLFKDFLNGKTNYEYDEWKHLSADCKSAALYLNFYDTIMAALYRARQHKPIPGDDTDLVSVATEKCQRIVEVLDTQPEKYTKGYVSLVMYNAFAVTLSQLVSSKQKRFDVFNVFSISETLDLLYPESQVADEADGKAGKLVEALSGFEMQNAIYEELRKVQFEAVVDNQPKYVREIIEKLINGGKLGKKQQQIIPYLREIFVEFAPECADTLI